MYETDAIDAQLLTDLLLNARQRSTPDTAAKVDVTPGTIRIDKLESSGVIKIRAHTPVFRRGSSGP